MIKKNLEGLRSSWQIPNKMENLLEHTAFLSGLIKYYTKTSFQKMSRWVFSLISEMSHVQTLKNILIFKKPISSCTVGQSTPERRLSRRLNCYIENILQLIIIHLTAESCSMVNKQTIWKKWIFHLVTFSQSIAFMVLIWLVLPQFPTEKKKKQLPL